MIVEAMLSKNKAKKAKQAVTNDTARQYVQTFSHRVIGWASLLQKVKCE